MLDYTGYCQSGAPAYAQRGLGKFIYQTLHDTSAEESSRILLFPTAGYSPETTLEAGLRAFSLYHARQDTANRLSELVLHGFVTLRGQFGVQLENAIYSNNNTYFILGKARYQQFPLLYFGNGPLATAGNPTLVRSDYSQFRQRLLRKITTNWYVGPEIDLQSMQNVRFENTDSPVMNLPPGSNGSLTLELGGSLIYDTRKNVLTVRNGLFLEITALRNIVKTQDFAFQRFFFDGRYYRTLGRINRVLAIQATGMFIQGEVPFSSLALLGGENTMRGYYLGRYRDKNLLAAQAELRWLPFTFSRRWGGTLFGGLGTVAPQVRSFHFNQIRWAVGGGLRFLFFQKKDVFLRADLGITQEGTGFYLSLGEAF
ncbi:MULTISPECIES: BamA/TamA family outer membrane protein [unclassified Spirosoma]|jgi:hypothetical protein|uniref:BamA/TamA family outer membrane protein n=1 Tax=unclassified Spirosoma TaxID=2621999 RepID=UPI0009593CDD|nr:MULTISPECIES: BamA/TamA family outer membrane protein [unclassified Spirosoma]MBN8826909.1 BamA/TamA family outer membrane protein [Spirosoma sp.]OJW72923.1 MAG: hypothetical protein BGO59_09270 [Spirosoma sp. 48-14]